MPECLFCKIVAGEIPSDKVFENDDVLAFRDISPVAPTHVLVVPKKHIASLNDVDAVTDLGLLAELLLAARTVAAQDNLSESGYRVVINTMKDAGQVVFHIHVHVVGGRAFGWPPG
jgi:histidine triad (HIT) family protein